MICDTFTCDDLKRACRAFFRDNDRECPENFDAHLNEVYAKYRERSYEVFVVSRASISKCQYTGLLDACKRSLESDDVFIDVADLTQFLNQGEPNVPIPSV